MRTLGSSEVQETTGSTRDNRWVNRLPDNKRYTDNGEVHHIAGNIPDNGDGRAHQTTEQRRHQPAGGPLDNRAYARQQDEGTPDNRGYTDNREIHQPTAGYNRQQLDTTDNRGYTRQQGAHRITGGTPENSRYTRQQGAQRITGGTPENSRYTRQQGGSTPDNRRDLRHQEFTSQ